MAENRCGIDCRDDIKSSLSVCLLAISYLLRTPCRAAKRTSTRQNYCSVCGIKLAGDAKQGISPPVLPHLRQQAKTRFLRWQHKNDSKRTEFCDTQQGPSGKTRVFSEFQELATCCWRTTYEFDSLQMERSFAAIKSFQVWQIGICCKKGLGEKQKLRKKKTVASS